MCVPAWCCSCPQSGSEETGDLGGLDGLLLCQRGRETAPSFFPSPLVTVRLERKVGDGTLCPELALIPPQSSPGALGELPSPSLTASPPSGTLRLDWPSQGSPGLPWVEKSRSEKWGLLPRGA